MKKEVLELRKMIETSNLSPSQVLYILPHFVLILSFPLFLLQHPFIKPFQILDHGSRYLRRRRFFPRKRFRDKEKRRSTYHVLVYLQSFVRDCINHHQYITIESNILGAAQDPGRPGRPIGPLSPCHFKKGKNIT